MTEGLRRRILGGAAWNVLSSIVRIGAELILLGVLARLLTLAEFGLVGAAMVVVGLASQLGQMGIGPALIQLHPLSLKALGSARTLSLLFSFAVGLLLVGFSAGLAGWFKMNELEPVLLALTSVFVLRTLSIVPESMLARGLAFKHLAWIESAAHAFGFLGLGLFAAFSGLGVWALVAAHFGLASLRLFGFVIVDQSSRGLAWDVREVSRLLKFGGAMTLSRLFNFVALQGDNAIVGRMMGPADLGVYGRAFQIVTAPIALLSQAADKALFPAIASIQDDRSRLRNGYLGALEVTLLAAGVVSVVGVMHSGSIVAVALGPRWIDVASPLAVLSGAIGFRAASQVNDSVIRGIGSMGARVAVQLLYAALVVLGSVLGIARGVEGVAVGVAGAVVIVYLASSLVAARAVGASSRDWIGVHVAPLGVATVTWGISTVGVSILESLGASEILSSALTVFAIVILGLWAVLSLPLARIPASLHWIIAAVRRS